MRVDRLQQQEEVGAMFRKLFKVLHTDNTPKVVCYVSVDISTVSSEMLSVVQQHQHGSAIRKHQL